jgi:aldose 1-epimerase
MKTIKSLFLGAGMAVAFLSACTSDGDLTQSGLNPANFKTEIDGKKVDLYVLKNNKGMEVCITNFGGRVVSLVVPDKNGKPTDVVLGYDNIQQYADTTKYASDYGSSVGRYANRINDGKFTLGDSVYQLRQNDTGNGAKHCLHGGGNTGWMNKVYDVKNYNDSTLVLQLVAEDGENGFPGTVIATTTYKVTADNSLDITFEAGTDKETIINMTNHNYYNLNGDMSKDGMDMVLYINADKFTPSDSTYMPTGEIVSVENTPMDFRTPTAIKDKMDENYDQIKNAGGYDHNWCLNTYDIEKKQGDDTTVCASLYSPTTGIFLEMFTNEPGVQVYTGNFQGKGEGADNKRKNGISYPTHVSVCLESQKYPNSPNADQWKDSKLVPSPVIAKGEKYYSHAKYRFSIK